MDYLRVVRPHEAPVTIDWIKNALNRDITISSVQRGITASGLKLIIWENNHINDEMKSLLTSDILADCFSSNSDISLEDLMTRNILFVARK